MKEILIILTCILLAGLRFYKSARFYVKNAQGGYEELQAKVVDYKLYTNHMAYCDERSLAAFYHNIYQYMEKGEYKIYEGNIHPIMLRFFLLKKGKEAYLYRELESGSIVEKPDTMESVMAVGPFLVMIVLVLLL